MEKTFSLILIALIMASAVPAYALPPSQALQQEQINARNMFAVTNAARERVELTLRNIMANATLVNSNKTTIDNCSAMLEQAKRLIEEANASLNNGSYGEAMGKLFEALRLLRNCFATLCELSHEELPRALGLIEAINNTGARIEKLNATLQALSERMNSVNSLIEKAKSTLNEAALLCSQGNASGAANKLGEVNSIMAQINAMLKNRAQERFMSRLSEFAERASKTNASMANTEEFRNMMRIIERNNVREAVNALKSIKIPERLPTTGGDLKLSVNASRNGVEIAISNNGDRSLLFPNSAYGITIERKLGNFWSLYYSPMAAQVITPLEPGKSANLKISLHLVPGTYRVVVKAWTEGMKEQTFASAEFAVK